MTDRIFGLLDMALVGLIVIGLAIWQLVSINREIARDRTPTPESSDRESPEGARHPVGEHRLDDR